MTFKAVSIKVLLFQIILFLSVPFTLGFNTPIENKSEAPMGTIPFITTWKTDNPGDTNDNQIRIATAPSSTYNYTVDWGDGNITIGETGDATHTYADPGTYIISITGLFPRIIFGNDDDQEKLLTIEQWGNNQWASMEEAFKGCSNLTGNFTDVPDLSNVTSMRRMFDGCTLYNSDMNNWDVDNVTDMRQLFQAAASFDSAIDAWNVSNVTSMQGMFARATSFDQDIGNWNTLNVTDMSGMFYLASTFNQDISFKPGMGIPTGDAWNTVNVTTMRTMFNEATVFNQDIGNWNTANVTEMDAMFLRAYAFNQDIGNWNVGKVIGMTQMLNRATAFDQDLSIWNVSSVQSFALMFALASAFDQDIGGWDTSSATTMWQMFSGANNFDQNLGGWNVSNVIDMRNMFSGVTLSTINYDGLLIGWNTQTLQPDLEFSGGGSQYCEGAAARANMIASDGWAIADGGLSGPAVTDLADQTQADSYTLPAITGTQLTGNEAYYTGTDGGGTRYDIGAVINFSDFPSYPVTLYIYDGTGSCSSEESFELNITSTPDSGAFITTWRTTATNEEIIIPTTGGGYNYTVDWGDGNTTTGETGNATHTYAIPDTYTVSITGDFPRIYFNTNGNPTATDNSAKILTIEKWGGNPWTSMFKAFTGCINLTGNFSDKPDLSNVTNTSGMFATCRLFNSNIDDWDMSNVTNMAFMFQNNASFNQPLNSWDVSSVTNMFIMFQGAVIFDQTLDNWNVENLTNADRMFDNATLSTANYDALLIGWNALDLQPNVIFSGGNSQYCEGATARANMVTSDGWDITDDGLAGPTITVLADQTQTDSYTLPAITGTKLTGNEAYYTGTDGGGTRYDIGAVINFADFPSYPVTLYMYDGTGSCSSEESFQLTINNTGTPVPDSCSDLTGPMPNETDVATDVGGISWSAVSGATGYRVSINGSTSNVNDITDQNVTGTSFTLPGDFNNGETVSVTIVPFNTTGDAVGCATPQNFTIVTTTPTVPDSCSDLTGPMPNDIDVATDVGGISWSAVSGVTGYRVSINGSTSNVNDITDQNIMGTSYTLPGDFNNGETVSVTIVPFNTTGDAVGCATPQSFTIVTNTPTVPDSCSDLTGPMANDTDVATDVGSISWSAVSGATGYRVSINGSTSNVNDIIDQNFMGTSYTLPGDFNNGDTVSVTIVPFNTTGDAVGCATPQSFTIVTTTPTVPDSCSDLTGPLANDIDVATDVGSISWSAVSGATGYRVSINGSTSNVNDITDQNIPGTSYTLPGDFNNGETVSVTIVPFNATGDALGCATPQSFTIETADEPVIPACTELIAELNNASEIPVTTNIAWNTIDNADGYWLSIRTAANEILLPETDLGILTTYSLSEELPFSTTILVSITPYNSEGNNDSCPELTFTTMTEPEEPVETDKTKYGFSPDGDGINDFWEIDGIEQYPTNTVTIYNRWGDAVFRIDNYDNAGSVFNGDANLKTKMGAGRLPAGTYFFDIQIEGETISKKTKGYVVIKR
ncbi:BspA family leucine-rich repeat surface protein [Maribacter sp. 2-571]|uniref:BspA family leucine-rich repeat surface protein n=1 Tax=Maribacter sp. 2-571 TaxID=3417569 RepID=UPI003D34EF1A